MIWVKTFFGEQEEAGKHWYRKHGKKARKYYLNIVIILLQRKLRDMSQQIRKNARLKSQLK